MANKSISMTQVRRIIQLKAEGLSKLKISGSLHIHRATLDTYLFKLEASGKSYAELLFCLCSVDAKGVLCLANKTYS
jgi:hypothetical protein